MKKMNSSEIELAIKLGKLIYNPEDYGSKQLAKTVEILDVALNIKPTQDHHLSFHLRTLVDHKGDVSFERFIQERLKDIAEDTEGFRYLSMEQLAYFIRGIGYLYPPSSMLWEMRDGTYMWNPAFALPGVYNHNKFYEYADELIEKAKEIRETNKAKRDAKL